MKSLSWLSAPLALLVVQRVFFPAPAGAILQGVVLGLLTALVSLGVVLVHRSNRVLNFAQGELGLLPTTLAVMLIVETGFAWAWGFLIGLAASAVVGIAAEFLIIRRFFRAPRLVLTVATLGLAQVLAFTSLLIPNWWDARVRSQRIDSPFDWKFEVGSFVFNDNHIMVLVIVPTVLVLVGALLRYTRVGIAIRASADLPDRASLLGIPVKGLQTVVWAIAAMLAFLALFLRAGVLGLPVGGQLGLLFFLRGLAAAVVGRLSDLRIVLLTSVMLGVLQVSITWNTDSPAKGDALMAAATALIILVALVLRKASTSRVRADDLTMALGEARPIPREMRGLREVVAVRWAGVAALAIVLLVVVPWWFETVNTLRASALLIFTVALMSLVVLTGWAGQISLGQGGFLSAGGAVGAWMTLNWQADLILVVLAAGLVGAALAVVIGVPALRLNGLYLAVTTLAFSLALSSYFLNQRFFDWVPGASERVERLPILGRISYTSPDGIYYVSVVFVVLVAIGLAGVRNSRTGRVLLALRDNEHGAEAYGISITRAKLTAFAISGFLASMAGALFTHHQQAFSTFQAGGDIGLFIAAVVGGIGSVAGAALGALYFWGTFWWLEGSWRIFASGFGVVMILLVAPGGIASFLYQGRDFLLRQLADRRGMLVPSLVADRMAHDDPELGDLINLPEPDLTEPEDTEPEGTDVVAPT